MIILLFFVFCFIFSIEYNYYEGTFLLLYCYLIVWSSSRILIVIVLMTGNQLKHSYNGAEIFERFLICSFSLPVNIRNHSSKSVEVF